MSYVLTHPKPLRRPLQRAVPTQHKPHHLLLQPALKTRFSYVTVFTYAVIIFILICTHERTVNVTHVIKNALSFRQKLNVFF